MAASKEPDNLTFMDLFRKEIMDCVTEAVSKAVPKASTTASNPLRSSAVRANRSRSSTFRAGFVIFERSRTMAVTSWRR